jgi:hypothetical protein
MQDWFCLLMKTRAIGSRLQKELQLRNINSSESKKMFFPE